MFAKEHLKFGNAEIEKIKFHCRKRAIAIGNININKIIMSDEFTCSKKGCKYFASCKNNKKKNTLLCVLLPKMSKYVKNFEDGKAMRFLFKDEELLVKYNEIWSKIKTIIGKETCNSDLVFDKKYLETRTKSYDDNITTNVDNVDDDNNKMRS